MRNGRSADDACVRRSKRCGGHHPRMLDFLLVDAYRGLRHRLAADERFAIHRRHCVRVVRIGVVDVRDVVNGVVVIHVRDRSAVDHGRVRDVHGLDVPWTHPISRYENVARA